MIGHIVKALRRKQRLLLGKVRADGFHVREGFCCGRTVVKAPDKIRSDDLVERIDVPPEQRARGFLEQLISLGGEEAMIQSCQLGRIGSIPPPGQEPVVLRSRTKFQSGGGPLCSQIVEGGSTHARGERKYAQMSTRTGMPTTIVSISQREIALFESSAKFSPREQHRRATSRRKVPENL